MQSKSLCHQLRSHPITQGGDSCKVDTTDPNKQATLQAKATSSVGLLLQERDKPHTDDN